jgi:hypothetical protein
VGNGKVCRQGRFGIEGDGCKSIAFSFFSSFQVLFVISGAVRHFGGVTHFGPASSFQVLVCHFRCVRRFGPPSFSFMPIDNFAFLIYFQHHQLLEKSPWKSLDRTSRRAPILDKPHL